jgi:hypothetical protein
MATNSTNFRTVSPVHLVIRDPMFSSSSTTLRRTPRWDDCRIPPIFYGGNNGSTGYEWFSTIPDAGAMVGANTGAFAAASPFAEFPLVPAWEREAMARTGGYQGIPPSADSFADASPFEEFPLFPAEVEDSPDGWLSSPLDVANPFAATSPVEESSLPAGELEVVDGNGNKIFRLSPDAANRSTAAPPVEECSISSGEKSPRQNRRPRSGNSAGSSTGSTTSGATTRRRRPIVIEDPDDYAAMKRARNTIASRKSRQKKVERMDYLEREIARLRGERDYWRSLVLASSAAQP